MWVIFGRFATENVNKLLVGNKCDLEEKRQVTYEEGAELAKQFDVPFLEVSAKNTKNVEETFTTMASEIQERFHKEKTEKKNPFDSSSGGTVLKPPTRGGPSMDEEGSLKKEKSNCCA